MPVPWTFQFSKNFVRMAEEWTPASFLFFFHENTNFSGLHLWNAYLKRRKSEWCSFQINILKKKEKYVYSCDMSITYSLVFHYIYIYREYHRDNERRTFPSINFENMINDKWLFLNTDIQMRRCCRFILFFFGRLSRSTNRLLLFARGI